MAKNIVVCCKLPAGIAIEHPTNPANVVVLNGSAKALIIGADHGKTEVDADFWGAWKAANKGFAPYVSGAIFEAKNVEEAEAVAKDRKGVKTGFEAMPREAQGVKPAEKE